MPCQVSNSRTGVNIVHDRIIELYAIKYKPDNTQEKIHHIFNPGIPIPAEASAIHGFTDDMVKDKPLFKQHATDLFTYFLEFDTSEG